MILYAGKYVDFQTSFARRIREGRYRDLDELMYEINVTRFSDIDLKNLPRVHWELQQLAKRLVDEREKKLLKEIAKDNTVSVETCQIGYLDIMIPKYL